MVVFLAWPGISSCMSNTKKAVPVDTACPRSFGPRPLPKPDRDQGGEQGARDARSKGGRTAAAAPIAEPRFCFVDIWLVGISHKIAFQGEPAAAHSQVTAQSAGRALD